jgi:hypothetical protein
MLNTDLTSHFTYKKPILILIWKDELSIRNKFYWYGILVQLEHNKENTRSFEIVIDFITRICSNLTKLCWWQGKSRCMLYIRSNTCSGNKRRSKPNHLCVVNAKILTSKTTWWGFNSGHIFMEYHISKIYF